MTEVAKRIEKLRALMAEQNIDAYVVPTADFHQSEYVGEHFKARKFITGFSGSYGTAVIAKDDAGLWTDGRYFTQALTEMEGSGVRLMKMFVDDTPSTTEWLAQKIPEGGKVAFDGRVLSMGEGQEYEEVLGAKNITIEYEVDLIDQIWEDRPTLSKKPCFFLEDKYTGENVASKLKRVREKMAEYGATVHLIASLDDNAWLLNFRGDDIDFFPLVLDYVIVRKDSVDLYIDDSKLNDRIREEMAKNNVNIHPYNDIYEDAKKIGADEVALIDRSTAGFTGADLENLLNEAALLAGRRDQKFITEDVIHEAVIKVIAGPEKRSRVIPEIERKLTAYHEAGHAVVIHALPDHDPVHQITIVPRGQAGGMTIFLPEEDRSYRSKAYMTEQIVSLLGGRAAEEMMLGDISTGASSDIQRATAIARKMVGTYGMSDRLGNVAFDAGTDEVFIGKSMGHTRPYSEKTAAEMDEEIRAMIDSAYDRCREILTAYRPQLVAVAEYLLVHETMDAETFEACFADTAAKHGE